MLESCLFSVAGGANSQLQWRVQVYPGGRGTENRDYLSVYLVLASDLGNQALRAKYKFSILNAKGAAGHSADNKTGAKFMAPGEAQGFDQFVGQEVLRDPANGLLPNNSLTIVCDGTAGGNRVSGSHLTAGTEVEDAADSECTLAEDLGALLESRELSDYSVCWW